MIVQDLILRALLEELRTQYQLGQGDLISVTSNLLNGLGANWPCKAVDMLELDCKFDILVRERSSSLFISISPIDLCLVDHLRSVIVGKLN